MKTEIVGRLLPGWLFSITLMLPSAAHTLGVAPAQFCAGHEWGCPKAAAVKLSPMDNVVAHEAIDFRFLSIILSFR